MRLPALISFIDATHCSENCILMHNNLRCCVARGDDPDRREILKRDGSNFVRTEYCRKKASNSDVKIETCPKCGGQCEGETYSFETTYQMWGQVHSGRGPGRALLARRNHLPTNL